jgi:hypothetical protein
LSSLAAYRSLLCVEFGGERLNNPMTVLKTGQVNHEMASSAFAYLRANVSARAGELPREHA